MTEPGRRSLRARWIFPVETEPIEDGTIEIDDSGLISALHSARNPGAEDLGNVAVIPGLVNTHTHLEFSDLTEPLGPREPFPSWIRALVASRRGRREPVAHAVTRGLRECATCGTTLLGEIATSDPPEAIHQLSGPEVVVFRELIGLRPEQIAEQLTIARRHLCQTKTTRDTANIVRGLSPHAPYSVHPDLLQGLVDLAEFHNAPLAMHLAETREELELLRSGSGPLVDMLRDFGVWQTDAFPGGRRPLDYLQPLVELSHVLIVHGNYLSDEEMDFVAEHENLTVVYCPRTHAYFGHSEHPWRTLLQRGARVAVGTDSRASNPDLSLWGELCFLRRRFPDVEPRLLLELGTINGARALGVEHRTGTLSAGKSADLAVVSVGNDRHSSPYELLFQSGNQIVGTMRSGTWIHREH